jgi:hypothetical protein
MLGAAELAAEPPLHHPGSALAGTPNEATNVIAAA